MPLVDLIAKGYGTLTWIFMFVTIVPLLKVGLLNICREHDGMNRGRLVHAEYDPLNLNDDAVTPSVIHQTKENTQ